MIKKKSNPQRNNKKEINATLKKNLPKDVLKKSEQ